MQQPTPAKPQSHHTLGLRTGVQETEAQPPSQALPGPLLTQDTQEGRVVCVQAAGIK